MQLDGLSAVPSMHRATFGRSHVISHRWYVLLVLQKVVLVPPLPVLLLMLVLELTLLLLFVVMLVLLLMLVLLDVTEVELAATLQAKSSRTAPIESFMCTPQ